MSRLIMWNLIALDGFFEGAKSRDLSWHERVWGEELERLFIGQLRSADGLLFGRVTYEGMAANWPSAEGEVAELMNRIPKVVISRTLERAEWTNTKLVNGDAVGEVSRLKAAGNRNTFVFGSGDLSATLTRHGLFDEFRLVVAPLSSAVEKRCSAAASANQSFGSWKRGLCRRAPSSSVTSPAIVREEKDQ